MKRLHRSGGFTLIELLVVISIVVLLVSILIPSLGIARERARKTTCGANLNGLGKALHMYADEYSGYLPTPSIYGDDGKITQLLTSFSQTYVPSPKSFYCPSDKPPALSSTPSTSVWDIPDSYRISYDFYSLYWSPTLAAKYDKVDRAGLVWDLEGGTGGYSGWQNHGSKGGNVIYGRGNAEWQDAKDWEKTNYPSPCLTVQNQVQADGG